jgi:hypothetical protein
VRTCPGARDCAVLTRFSTFSLPVASMPMSSRLVEILRKVVEVVSDAGPQLINRLHLLRLLQCALRTLESFGSGPFLLMSRPLQ